MALRLIFVSHSLPPEGRPDDNIGGMQRVALELHRALSHHPDVAYEPVVMRATWAQTHRRVVPFLAKTLRTLRKRIASGEVDAILYSSMVTASLDTLLVRQRERHGVCAAAIVHGLDVTTDVRAYQWFVPRVFAALDLVLPVSRATGDACIERRLDTSKLHVVSNGVDVRRFAFPEESDFAVRPVERPSLVELAAGAEGEAGSARLLSEAPSNSDAGSAPGPMLDDALLHRARFVLCSVGRHVERKGFGWFIRSVMPLLPDDVIYVIVGDGPESDNIRQAATDAGVAERVLLPGLVSEADLARLYAGSDLFIMPNIPVIGDMEGFGVVLLEAGLSGAPAIAAGIEGILDVIEEGENGTLVSSGDAEGFAAAIMSYYDNHAAVVTAAHCTREFTVATFGWDAVADRYVAALRGLVSAAGGVVSE